LVSCENSHELISVNLKRYIIFHEICEWFDVSLEFCDFSSRKNSQDKGSRQLSLFRTRPDALAPCPTATAYGVAGCSVVLSHRSGLPPRQVTTPAAAASNIHRVAQRLLEPGATGRAMESNDANF
jgi:hypothetical protein